MKNFPGTPSSKTLVLTLALTLALAGPAFALPDFDPQEAAAFVQQEADEGRFSGTVLVARDGQAVFTAAHGFANLDYEVPNRLDTKFNLGSMNKMFTAVAVAQLAEAGKLSFEDTIADLVPDYPNREVARQVTVHQLLTHTSGMGSYFTPEYQRTSKDLFRAVEDYLPLFVDEPLLFAPGAKYSYSNSGFMVLGLIIERVSGQDYFSYVREHIYEPAGMVNTDAYELDAIVPNHAVGYTQYNSPDGQLRNNVFLHVVKGGPAGGGYSTVEDLLRFANALLGHQLLSPETTRRVLEGKVEIDGPDRTYAYGFRNTVENGQRMIGHGGGFPGINSRLEMYPDLGYTVAVMSNRDLGTFAVGEHIQAQLIGKTKAVRDRELTEAVLAALVQHGYEAGRAVYEAKRAEGSVVEDQVNVRGYELLGDGQAAQAVDVFRFNCSVFPESANCYDSLGEACLAAGDTAQAVANYEKSVALDPGNENGAQILRSLLGPADR